MTCPASTVLKCLKTMTGMLTNQVFTANNYHYKHHHPTTTTIAVLLVHNRQLSSSSTFLYNLARQERKPCNQESRRMCVNWSKRCLPYSRNCSASGIFALRPHFRGFVSTEQDTKQSAPRLCLGLPSPESLTLSFDLRRSRSQPFILYKFAIPKQASKQASKQAYLFVNKNDRLPKKPLAQQCWQPIVSTTVKTVNFCTVQYCHLR